MRFVQTNLNAISSCPQIEQADNVVAFIVLFKGMPSLISDMEYQKIEIMIKVDIPKRAKKSLSKV